MCVRETWWLPISLKFWSSNYEVRSILDPRTRSQNSRLRRSTMPRPRPRGTGLSRSASKASLTLRSLSNQTSSSTSTSRDAWLPTSLVALCRPLVLSSRDALSRVARSFGCAYLQPPPTPSGRVMGGSVGCGVCVGGGRGALLACFNGHLIYAPNDDATCIHPPGVSSLLSVCRKL